MNSKHVNWKEARIGQRANGVIMMKENTLEFENEILEIELGMKQEVGRGSEYWKCSEMLSNRNVAMTVLPLYGLISRRLKQAGEALDKLGAKRVLDREW